VGIIFPDTVFEYASSLIRRSPALFENTAGAKSATAATLAESET